jgi:hypothetical protein
MGWVDTAALGSTPVLIGHRQPGEAKRVPSPGAVAVVPMTFNTLNAWAAGLAGTYPLVTLCTALGTRVPTVAVPFTNHDLAGHPAWLASLAVLRHAGVTLIDPTTGRPGSVEPITSGTGERVTELFQWSWVLDQLDPDAR